VLTVYPIRIKTVWYQICLWR